MQHTVPDTQFHNWKWTWWQNASQAQWACSWLIWIFESIVNLPQQNIMAWSSVHGFFVVRLVHGQNKSSEKLRHSPYKKKYCEGPWNVVWWLDPLEVFIQIPCWVSTDRKLFISIRDNWWLESSFLHYWLLFRNAKVLKKFLLGECRLR